MAGFFNKVIQSSHKEITKEEAFSALRQLETQRGLAEKMCIINPSEANQQAATVLKECVEKFEAQVQNVAESTSRPSV